MIKFVSCIAASYCRNHGAGCSDCIYFYYSRTPINVNNFLSKKCGSQSDLCARCHDFDACYDCDPYDPPCSLFKCSVTFGGGENNG